MKTVDPRNIEVRTWCDFTAGNIASIVAPMKVEEDDQWRRFGEHARMLLRARGVSVPDPAQFSDWRDWAIRFNQGIANV